MNTQQNLAIVIGEAVNEEALKEAGYVKEQHAATWEDVGSPESGPKLGGGPAYDEWSKGDHSIYVVDGLIDGEECYQHCQR